MFMLLCMIKTHIGLLLDYQDWLVLGLLFRIWAELKIEMDIIALETDSMTSKTPDNMYHT